MKNIHSKDWYVEDEWQLDADTPYNKWKREEDVENDALQPWEEGLFQAVDEDNERYGRDDEDMEFMMDTFMDGFDHAS